MTTWLARYQRFWDESHEQLDELPAALQGGPGDNPGRGRAVRSKGNDDG